MIVAGGTYREECISPHWARIFGSGGRAAAAVSALSPKSVLHTYASSAWSADLHASMEAFGVHAEVVEIDADICFQYFHPLSVPRLYPQSIARFPSLHVKGDAILRFGFVEGDAVVEGERVVYDPQNWTEALGFRKNGSIARKLSIVLNETELRLSTNEADVALAASLLRKETEADVIVVKRGPRGVLVFEESTASTVPAYKTDSLFKIGSGDVFSAVFALEWAEKCKPPVEAAFAASRAVAHYVASRSAQVPTNLTLDIEAAPTEAQSGPIYLAGPFFHLGQRWVVEESLRALEGLGAAVFSPLHEVGTGYPSEDIARRDLAGLDAAKAVFAIIDGGDPGTLFEIGYARARGKPVVAFAEAMKPSDLTMLSGSECAIFDDFAAAIYHAVWAAMS